MPESVEPIGIINRRLKDNFGINTGDGRPIWRIVWSEDQFENRHGTYDDYSPGGIYLRTVTETRYVKKYDKIFNKDRFILEQLVAIGPIDMGTLPGEQTSYEPMYVFETNNGVFLPPKYEVAEIIIQSVLAVRGKGNIRKWVEPTSQEELIERAKRIEQLQEEIFGEDSGITEKHGDTIFVPGPKGVN